MTMQADIAVSWQCFQSAIRIAVYLQSPGRWYWAVEVDGRREGDGVMMSRQEAWDEANLCWERWQERVE